jgi:hypothetical protein
MKKFSILLFVFILGFVTFSINWAVSDSKPTERERRNQVIGWVDNNAYWQRMAAKGLAVLNPDVRAPEAVFTGSHIKATTVITDDSPDVPVTEVGSSTQSENSVFVDPNDPDIMLNSNNSTSVTGPPSYGADALYTFDFAETFDGTISGAAGNNDGDPAACIGTDGRWYVGYIANSGQAVAYSDNQGTSWTRKQVAPNPGQVADKNHLWIDTKEGSPYENHLYDAWTDYGGSYDNQIVVSHSTDNGDTWSTKQRISLGVNAGHHNQGVNLSTGPNGEVYAVWAIYDGWPQDEKALGFAKSLDGGQSWENSYRIINNIRGIRQSGVPQNMRVAGFPAMAVDISGGSNDGNIYVVWTNVGIPGQNSGSDRDVYLIKSEDGGDNWSEPIRVNQDPISQGKAHYMPWIAVDPSNGTVSVIWYDNRNTNSNQAEAWVATSNDAAETWEDFKVSDVAFTPSPIPGMANGYFGDYLGITALNGNVYPCWTDNRSGHAMTYVSPFVTITVTNPFNLQANVDQETGACELNWSYNEGSGFQNFRIYRNDEMIAETEDMTYTDQIPEYGYYTYKVTAYYGGTTESAPTSTDAQWGTSSMEVIPGEYTANLYINDSVTQIMKIKNTGVLELDFSLSPFFTPLNVANYETAMGGGDEYISKVVFAGIDNTSGSENYSNYTDNFARLQAGESYEIRVFNGNAYDGDQCSVWIDWNANGAFDEKPIVLFANETTQLFKGIITPPQSSIQGTVLMRIRLAGPGNMSAYGDTQYGEVEDYSLLIASWLSLVPDEGLVAPGDSLLIDLKFNATGMETGTYTDMVKFISNDLDNPFYNVPVTLNVTDLAVVASADPSEICLGSSTQLSASPQGGSGTYTYSWTSIPEGFSSDEQNPVVEPIVNTKYFVAVNDGVLTMTDSAEVAVFALPVADLGEDLVLCGETQYFLDAGNPGATYLWSTGQTTQTIVVVGEGENQYWVEVTNENNCTDSDTINIMFAPLPQVDLGIDTVICHDQTYTLDAGNAGESFLWSTGETTQTIVVDAANYEYGIETFSVTVTNQYACEGSDEVSIEIKDCTGIDEINPSVAISLFPNPANGIFKLELQSVGRLQVNIKIMSVSGTLVYEKPDVEINGSYSRDIDLSNLSSGIYSVFVIGDDFITNKKIILKK